MCFKKYHVYAGSYETYTLQEANVYTTSIEARLAERASLSGSASKSAFRRCPGTSRNAQQGAITCLIVVIREGFVHLPTKVSYTASSGRISGPHTRVYALSSGRFRLPRSGRSFEGVSQFPSYHRQGCHPFTSPIPPDRSASNVLSLRRCRSA